jgi:integrase
MKGRVYKRGKSWYYRFDIEPDPLTGKRRQVNGSGYRTEREAWKACRDTMADHEKGRLASSSRRKVGEALDEWLTRIEHSIKPSMTQNWRNYAAYYVVPYIGSRDVRDIDGAVCDALYAKLLAEGRVKARPKQQASTQAVHMRRLAEDGREMPCRPYSYDTVRCHRKHAEHDQVIGQPIKPKKLGRRAAEDAAEAAERKLSPGLEPKTVFFALWVLEATSGMRRCELAGARRDLLDLDAGTLTIEVTRVVVDGRVIESDGKTENAQHVLALDPFTLAVLKAHVETLDRERRELGPDYQDHGVLFCWGDGKPPHPDTITRRFKKLAAAAGLPEIDLHDVRHSYATAGRDAKIDWKALSKRIGHADVAFTMKQYVQTDLEADRRVANTLAELIIGGALASLQVGTSQGAA